MMWYSAFLACEQPSSDGPKNDADSGVSALTGETGLPVGHSATPHSSTTPTGQTGTAETAATGDTGGSGTNPEPDFHLVNLNPTSPTLNQVMSPRDQLLKVSGWYFTHAS